MNGPDEEDFESMMRQLGVDRIAPTSQRPKPDKRPEPPREPEREREPERRAHPSPRHPPTPPPNAHEEALAAVRSDNTALTARVAELEEQLAAAKAAHAKDSADLQKRLEQLDNERRALQRKLSSVPSARPAQPAADVFSARDLLPGDEHDRALLGLATKRPAELLDALQLADPLPLARLLDKRVVLLGATTDAQVDAGVVAVIVPPDRCELGGAGVVNAAWRRFAKACDDGNVTRITLVGGSPAYRKQLRACLEDTGVGPRLDLVSGTKRRPAHKAASDIRSSDLVLIWAATELDHAVSAPYTDARSDKVHVIAHRGISGMLRAATDIVSRRAARP